MNMGFVHNDHPMFVGPSTHRSELVFDCKTGKTNYYEDQTSAATIYLRSSLRLSHAVIIWMQEIVSTNQEQKPTIKLNHQTPFQKPFTLKILYDTVCKAIWLKMIQVHELSKPKIVQPERDTSEMKGIWAQPRVPAIYIHGSETVPSNSQTWQWNITPT